MNELKIYQENPEKFENPRFFYKFTDAEGKKHRKFCPRDCKTLEHAQKYVSKLSLNFESEYKICNIAKDMFVENSEHLKRLECFGKKIDISTIKSKRHYIELIISKFGNRNIFELKVSEIEKHLLNDHSHGNSWKNSYLDTFRCIYDETLWLDKQCARPKFHHFIRNSRKADIFTIEELKDLFNVNFWKSYDEFLLFKIMFFCGLRISEARALCPNQFIWNENVLLINGFCKLNGTKTNYNKKGSSDNPKFRITVLPTELQRDVYNFIARKRIKKDDFIFKYKNKPFKKELLETHFKKALEKSNIKINGRKLIPHSLRFTYVTLMRRKLQGDQVRLFVGHTTMEMTDYYTRYTIENSLRAIQEDSFEAVNTLLLN